MGEPETLSEREMEVVRLVAKGLTNDQIAQDLFISANTVKVHLRNIFAKLGVASRTEASLYAVRQGWVVLGAPTQPLEEPLPPPEPAEAPVSPPILHPWTRWLVGASIVILLLSLTISLTGFPLGLLSPTVSPAPTTVAAVGWTERAALTSPRAHLTLVPFQGTLYAIGGEGPEGVSGVSERYDPEADTWTTLATKPTAVADAQGAVLGGHIYVPGGRGAAGQPTQVVEVYLVERNQWTGVAPLLHPLSAYALVAFEGKLYLLGGWDGTRYRDEILRYTPEIDQWELVGRLFYPCGFASAIAADNRILLLGGVNAEGPLDVVLEYTPALAAMNPQPLADVALGRTQPALFGDYLYILADPGGSAAPQIWRHNLRTAPWQVVPPPADGIPSGAGLAGLGSNILLVGGESGGKPLSQVLEYQAIFSVEPLPPPRP